MVTARLSLKDAKEKGWLLDGYPRSLAQAKSLENLKIRPDVYIMLDVRHYVFHNHAANLFSYLLQYHISILEVNPS